MRSKTLLVGLGTLVLTWISAAHALEFREDPYRVGIVDVGEPILLGYTELTNEMGLNSELRDWIKAYGRPEYAEFQKVELSDPFLAYEVRLYYIEGRRYVAFGRVNVSPSMRDYGVRKFIGKLDGSILQRLLTAKPMKGSASGAMASAAPVVIQEPYYESAPTGLPLPDGVEIPIGEEIVIEEIIEIEPEGEAVPVEVGAMEETIIIEPADEARVVIIQPESTVVEEVVIMDEVVEELAEP